MGTKEKERRKKRMTSAKKGNEALGGFWPSYLHPIDGVGMFKYKEEKDYDLDFVPFVASDRKLQYKRADPGHLYYVVTYDIHSNIGTDEKSVICLRTFGKPCPICKKTNQLVSEGQIVQDSDAHTALKPKRRQLFLVVDRDEPTKLQVYETAYFKSFGVMLKEMLDKDPDNEKGWDTFYDPDGGFTVHVITAKDNFKGRDFNKPVKLSFVKRPEGIPADIAALSYTDEYEPVIDLEGLLIELPAEQLLAMFTGEEDEAPPTKDKEDVAPKAKASPAKDTPKAGAINGAPKTPPPKDGEGTETAKDKGITKGSKVTHKKLGVCEVMKVSPDGSSLTLQDEDGDLHEAVAPSKCELVKEDEDEDEDDAPPPKKPQGKKPAPAKDEDEGDEDEDTEDDEDEEDDDDEDDKPAKKPAGKKPAKDDDDDDDWEDED